MSAVVIFQALSVVATLASGWFVTRLHITTHGHWRDSVMGWLAALSSGSLFILLTLTTTRQLFGDYPGRVPALMAGFTAFSAILVWQCWLLERSARAARRISDGKG